MSLKSERAARVEAERSLRAELSRIEGDLKRPIGIARSQSLKERKNQILAQLETLTQDSRSLIAA
jgi:hypothetical protein